MDKSYSYLNSKLDDNEYVVIALSGGPDSMALLNILMDLREEKNINIVCAHVNHNLRKESEEEKVFVEEYCKKNNIIFEYMKIESYKNGFSEKEARSIRYDFFDKVMSKYKARYLVTAHHGDDLIETILMRIGRGSNLKGYAGFSIESERHGYKLLKPLIYYTKSEIMLYLDKYSIPYVLDNTNLEDNYTRNRYRHNVLPFLKEENKDVNEKYLKFSENLLLYDNYIEKVTNEYLDKIYKDNKLIISEYLKLDELIRMRILHSILYTIYKDDITLVSDSNVNEIDNIITSNKPNISIKLPNNVVINKTYDILSFNDESITNDKYRKELVNNLEIDNKKFMYVDSEDSDSNYVCRLSSKDIKLPLYVRTRLDGDKIEVKNLNGSKKVKDIFIDEKLSIKDRNSYPIVVDSDGNVIWIPGIKKSKHNKEKDEKYDIIIKCVKL